MVGFKTLCRLLLGLIGLCWVVIAVCLDAGYSVVLLLVDGVVVSCFIMLVSFGLLF